MLQKAALDLHAPHHAGRDNRGYARNVIATGLGIEGVEDGLGEGISDDGHALRLVPVDGDQQLLGVKGFALKGDDAAPGQHGPKGRQETRTVHQRRRWQGAAAWTDGLGEFNQLRQGFGHWSQQPGRPQRYLAQVLVRPHHALGHAGGAAGVDEKLILAGAGDIQRAAVAFDGQGVDALGERRQAGLVAGLEPGVDHRQTRTDLFHHATKFGRVDHRLRVAVVENVADLVGGVAIVDVDVGQARLPPRRQGQQIFGAVAHVDGDLVAGPRAPRDQAAGEAVGGAVRFAPADDPLAMQKGRRLRRDRACDGVKDIAKVPAHGRIKSSRLGFQHPATPAVAAPYPVYSPRRARQIAVHLASTTVYA